MGKSKAVKEVAESIEKLEDTPAVLEAMAANELASETGSEDALFGLEKVKMPVFRDGLQSFKTYLHISVCNGDKPYNTLCVRNLGEAVRVHAYPDFETFNLNSDQLIEMGFSPTEQRVEQGYYTTAGSVGDAFHQLVDYMQGQEAFTTVPMQKIAEAFGWEEITKHRYGPYLDIHKAA